LRSLEVDRVVEQQRHTRQWKRPPKVGLGS
jgi:hypothetical protein